MAFYFMVFFYDAIFSIMLFYDDIFTMIFFKWRFLRHIFQIKEENRERSIIKRQLYSKKSSRYLKYEIYDSRLKRYI